MDTNLENEINNLRDRVGALEAKLAPSRPRTVLDDVRDIIGCGPDEDAADAAKQLVEKRDLLQHLCDDLIAQRDQHEKLMNEIWGAIGSQNCTSTRLLDVVKSLVQDRDDLRHGIDQTTKKALDREDQLNRQIRYLTDQRDGTYRTMNEAWDALGTDTGAETLLPAAIRSLRKDLEETRVALEDRSTLFRENTELRSERDLLAGQQAPLRKALDDMRFFRDKLIAERDNAKRDLRDVQADRDRMAEELAKFKEAECLEDLSLAEVCGAATQRVVEKWLQQFNPSEEQLKAAMDITAGRYQQMAEDCRKLVKIMDENLLDDEDERAVAEIKSRLEKGGAK